MMPIFRGPIRLLNNYIRTLCDAIRLFSPVGGSRMLLRVIVFVLVLGVMAQPVVAQTRKTTTATTSKRKTTTSSSRSSSSKSRTTTTRRKSSTSKSRTKSAKSRSTSSRRKSSGTNTKAAPSVSSLKSQRDALQKKISQSQAQLSKTNRDVKVQLGNLAVINAQIEGHQRNIGNIRTQLDTVKRNIGNLEVEIGRLSAQLKDRKQKYARSMVYLYQNRKTSNKLLFLLSSKDFSEMARRYRYVKEYSKYQRVQGELVQRKQTELLQAKTRLDDEKIRHTALLNKEEDENRKLAVKQSEQQSTVSSLQKKQKNLQQVIAFGQKEMAALNAKIDYYVKLAIEQERKRREEAERKAREVERRAREAEKRRKELAEAAERSRQRDEARRTAAAKKGSKQASANSDLASATSGKSSSGSANASSSRGKSSPMSSNTEPTPRYQSNNREYQLTSNFAANKGRLPVPITGAYLISTHFGSYTMNGMKNVRLYSNGINLTGQGGAQARCIFDGEVTAVFSVGGLKNVMVRHGSYISVYCNLRSVSVSQGQHVSARQSLGAVAPDATGKPNLHFQLRKEAATLNPEQWLAR